MAESNHMLAAIMFTDIVGYTALMGESEMKAYQLLKKNRQIQKPIIEKHNGKWLKEIGDGVLASFQTVSDAVYCAIEIQEACLNEPDLKLRIGIHLGEVIVEEGDMFGDGVNIASRLEPLAPIGGIYVSESVFRNIQNKEGIKAEFVKEETLKNVKHPVRIYQVMVYQSELHPPSIPIHLQPFNRKTAIYVVLAIIICITTAIYIYFNFTKDENITRTVTTKVIDKSIAVLPFINDSPDKDNEYFCNGMLEEIITHLQKIGDLNVKSRTSVEQYRNPSQNIKIIGSELGVAFLVEGSVRKVGDDLRITAQLIETETGNHLWAEIYDGKYTEEIFEFQSKIAKQIVSSLKVLITPEEEQRIERQPTSEILAWDLVQRGMDEVDNYSKFNFDKKHLVNAKNFFDKALEIDPMYSRAVSAKGHAYFMEGKRDSAMMYAERAITLDPDNEAGYHLKGSCHFVLGNSDLAIEYFLKAAELAPNNNWPNIMLGLTYSNQKNDVIKGLPYFSKALKLGGRSQWANYLYIGSIFRKIGNYKKAEEYFKKVIELQEGCAGISSYSTLLIVQGKYSEAQHFLDSICNDMVCESRCLRQMFFIYLGRKEFIQAEQYYNNFVEAGGTFGASDSVRLAYVYKELGREQEALTILSNLRILFEGQLAERETPLEYFNLSLIHSILDEKVEALKYLSQTEKLGFDLGWHDYIEIHPAFENLWADLEFKAITKRAQEDKAAQRAIVQQMIESGDIDL
jgi:TolB-like protein/class 3 adenylate cyclase/Tfp pilus assembly protein PilF